MVKTGVGQEKPVLVLITRTNTETGPVDQRLDRLTCIQKAARSNRARSTITHFYANVERV